MEGRTRYGRKGLKAKGRVKWKVPFERLAVVKFAEKDVVELAGAVIADASYMLRLLLV